jgi:microcystin-dependent protein
MRTFSLALAAAVLSCAMCLNPTIARAQAEPFIGQIATFGFNFCPNGWAPLNGQLLPINQNQPLFALIGTYYGGNGTTNFALPTGKPIFTATGFPFTQCIALLGIFPSRN